MNKIYKYLKSIHKEYLKLYYCLPITLQDLLYQTMRFLVPVACALLLQEFFDWWEQYKADNYDYGDEDIDSSSYDDEDD